MMNLRFFQLINLSSTKNKIKQMKSLFIKFMALLLIASLGTSCQKKVNDWDVDPSHDRLFKSLTFAVATTEATSVVLRYTKSTAANKYIFEFSKDSLEFGKIVRTVEILADTLTPFAKSPTPTRVEYRTTFDDLDGTSGYSVRMKSVDTVTGSESKYSQLYFETPAEQLFQRWEVSTDHIQMYWVPTDRITHIMVSDPVTGAVLKKVTLTNGDKQKGSVDITGLSPGTNYQIVIYNGEVVRGTKVLKTSGLAGAVIVPVNPGDDIAALVADAVAHGKPSVTLLFKGGGTYDIGSLTLPAGLSSISFTGDHEVSGTTALPATLNISEVRLTDLSFGKMIFEKVKLIGGTGDFLINLADDNTQIESYSFDNCIIKDYRSVVRIQKKLIRLKQIKIENSILENTGGYGVVNVGGASVTLDSIKIMNNTMVDISTQLMDVRSTVGGIIVDNNTIYNQASALTQLIRLDKNNLPSFFEAANNIITGTNSGAPLKSFSLSYEGSFAGSYRTSEMEISQDFPEITVFSGSSTDLFVDPEGGDFTIKPASGFGGIGTAGDPRWW